MADLVFGKEVRIETHGKDRYGRVIGDVVVDGKSVNGIMVRQGWAWNFVKYSKSPRLSELEREARAERRGLWGWDLTGCSGGSCPTPQAQEQQQIPSSCYTSPDGGSFFLTVVELTIRVLMGVIPSCWANSSCTAEANKSLPAAETAAPGFED